MFPLLPDRLLSAVFIPLIIIVMASLTDVRPAVAASQAAAAESPSSTSARPPGDGRIEGAATDRATGKAIPGVQIFLEGTGLGTVTNSDGRFAIEKVPVGQYDIVARFVGYRTERRSIVVNSDRTTRVDFRLSVEAVRLQEAVVTATGERQDRSTVPATIGVIDEDAIRRARPAHPSEILGRIPGVWVNATSGEGHMTAIRQPLTTDPVYLYLENGVPTRSTGFFNHNALYEINLPMAGGVEIIKGPGTALYGSDAIGAVINVSTAQPPDVMQADLSVEGGAFGFQRMMLGGGATFGGHGLRFDLNGTKSDGWRDASGYDRQSGTVTWEVTLPGVSRLRTVASFSHVDQEPAGTSALNEADFRRQPTANYAPISYRQVNAVRISSAYERFTPQSSVTVTPFVRHNEMEILPDWSLSYDPVVYSTRNVSAGLQARYRRDVEWMDARFITGVDFDYSPGEHIEHRIEPVRVEKIFTAYDRLEAIYEYDVSFRQASPFIHLEAEMLHDLRFSGGLRVDALGYDYDNNLSVVTTGNHRRAAGTTKSFIHASPKLGATYRVRGFGSLFLSYAHAFRVPSESQLFRQGATSNTLDLLPVKADNLEAGIRGRIGSLLRVDISGYRMMKRDDIISFTNSEGLRISTNSGRTSHTGLEAGISLLTTAGLTLDAGYSYAIHRFEDWRTSSALGANFSGNEMPAAPRVMARASIAYEPSFAGGSGVRVEWVRLGAYWMDPANTVTYDGHGLIHVRATARLPAGFAVFGRLTNVTNERYADLASYNVFRGREYAPGLPRALFIGLEYQIQND